MASYTTNLNLKKPAGSENVAIGDINGNMDTIDAAYGALNSNLSKRITTTDITNATVIPDNSDINNYKTGGIYYVASDASAGTITNMPRNASGRLIVIPVFSDNSNYIHQIYIPSTTINLIYIRKYGSSWTEWSKMANYVVDVGTVTTSSSGTASLYKTYNTNEYAVLSVFTTEAVGGRILIPYKYGDAANGRWGFKCCSSSDMSGVANTSISYVAILMPYSVS